MDQEQNGSLIRLRTAIASSQGAAYAGWAIIVPPAVADDLIENKYADRIPDRRDLTPADHRRGINFHPFRGYVEKIPQMKADREKQRKLDELAKEAGLVQQDTFKLLAESMRELGKTLAAIQSHLGDTARERTDKPDTSEAVGPRSHKR